jgi:hypothetical protein
MYTEPRSQLSSNPTPAIGCPILSGLTAKGGTENSHKHAQNVIISSLLYVAILNKAKNPRICPCLLYVVILNGVKDSCISPFVLAVVGFWNRRYIILYRSF